MKTLSQMARDYANQNPDDTVQAYTDGYIEGFRDQLVKEQEIKAMMLSKKINLESVFSFHQQAINLIERAMKELE